MAKLSNRFWFSFHGWCSLPIWVLFCFICLTGTVAVISHELTWLTNPNARALNPDELPAKNAAELVKIVQQAHPTAEVSTLLLYEPYLTAGVIFSDQQRPFATAYVNPYTGAIQEINEGLTFIGFMRSLHGWLLFPWQHNYSIGYYLVSAMGFVLLGALISGLMIYKQFWKAFSQPKIRFNQGSKTLLADLHRTAGVWSIWFMVIICITSLWYLLQGILMHNDIEVEPHAPLVAITELPSAKPNEFPVSLAQALATAKQQYPAFSPSYIALPEHNRDNYHLYGSGANPFFDQYAYQMAINPWQGEISQQLAPDNMNTMQTVMHIVDPLHYGTLGGIWTKIIWFIFGALLTGMSFTGFLMWRKRLVKVKPPRQSQTTTQTAAQTAQPVGESR
ncbi:PepSY domain-containing protein [Shewanella avicenniae]|uniref:PepSY domain-containing protein n=1 Tax=Shewanella avicenniae TaxID=2814294 RepID=A0ABX7QTP6_9GAMM|nr:PepSY-associated TM helix domain-containing protein [Shewanella avicenniae]QSX34213.1 PepSY domain-containing protein [Shewanella avicenniae]